VRRVVQPATKRDDAVGAESSTGRSRLRIERNDARIDRGGVDPTTTRGIRGSARVEPRRDTPVGEIAPITLVIDLGVEDPPPRTSFGIERDHAPKGRREVKRSVDDQRRGLELCRLPAGLARLARSIRPRDGEPIDVRSVDLCERRKTAAELI